MNEINQPQPQPQQVQQLAAAKIPRKHKKIPVFEILIGAGVLLIISYFSFNWIMGVLIHHRAEVQVPDIKGKSLLTSFETLSSLQLALIKDSDEFNQSLPEGSILRQTPIPGTMVREGKTIRVVLSKGGEQVFVPDLINKPLRLAEIDLRQTNLALGEVSERYSLSAPKSHVLFHDPEEGMVVERNSLIHFIISSGPPPEGIILMPDFTDKTIEDVKQWAEDKNLTVSKFIDDPLSAVPAGEIIRQKPGSDTIIDDSSNIQFTVGVSTAIASADHIWHYALPQGAGKRKVLVKLVGDSFEHIIFKGTKSPGSKIDIPFHYRKNARMQIYLNNILIEERKIP